MATKKEKRPALFYSWQSDHAKTRSYIENCLKKALEKVAATIDLENAPRLDKDTQGEVGAVSIPSIIRKKISDCKIFLADISVVDKGESGRKIVNQNVMFELGYAFGKKTENAVMLVANQDLGDAKDLPFDIAQNRIIFCSPKEDPKGTKLVSVLEYAIKAHLGFIDETEKAKTMEDDKEQLLGAIDLGKPTQTKAEKYFNGLYKRYLAVAPGRYAGENLEIYGEEVADSYQKSLPITLELFDVIQMASEYGNSDTIIAAYKLLGTLTAMYDVQPEDNGRKYTVSDDYYALLIQEIASIILGLLAKYNQWEIVGDLIPKEFIKPKNGTKKYSISETYKYPGSIKPYYTKKTGVSYAVPTTPLIQERFVDHDAVMKAYADGALILMFALGFYYPFVSGLYLSDESYIPEYLPELKKKVFSEKFRSALGLKDINELQERLDEKRKQNLAGGGTYWNQNISHLFETAGILPVTGIGTIS